MQFGDAHRRVLGDSRVYFWYRDSPPCPDAVVSCLMALEKWFYDELDAGRDVEWAILRITQSTSSLALIGLISAVGAKSPQLFRGPLRSLLAIPEFHFWESQQILQPDGYLMLGWERKGELLFNLARDWHTLPHRKHGISYRARIQFLKDSEIQSFMTDQLSSWRSRLDATEDSHFKYFLEKLIAQFDINNYGLIEHPEHGEGIAFVPPADLRSKHDAIGKDNEDRLKLFMFPVRCKRLFDQGGFPDNLSPDEFWKELKYVLTLERFTREDTESFRMENSLSGGAAVLVCLCRDWLKNHPEVETWCRYTLVRTTLSPPQPDKLDSPVSAFDCYWDSFCARAIPVLWAESPEDRELRQCVANLSIHLHHKTIELLFASAASKRSSLAAHFGQLRNFHFNYAMLVAPGRNSYRTKRADRLIQKSLGKLMDRFVGGIIPSGLPSWPKSRERSKKAPKKSRQVSRLTMGIDVTLVMLSHKWIPSLESAISPQEREEWATFWIQALSVTLSAFDPVKPEDEMEGPMFDWDHWLLGNIASSVASSETAAEAKRFWEPILVLGTPGHAWIDGFLSRWFQICLKGDKRHDEYFERWMEMIEWAFESAQWDHKEVTRDYRLDEMWCRLLGFSHWENHRWTSCKYSLPHKLVDLYFRWGDNAVLGSSTLSGLVAFLRTAPAIPILTQGVKWIATRITIDQSSDGRLLQERGLADEIARLLSHVWSSRRGILSNQNSTISHFQSLLNALIDTQNAIALELHRIVSVSGDTVQ